MKNKGISMVKDKCKCCGLCCVVFNYMMGFFEPCFYLDSKTKKCKIYKRRLGVPLGGSTYCIEREKSEVDYPNCPMNKGLPIHPAYSEEK